MENTLNQTFTAWLLDYTNIMSQLSPYLKIIDASNMIAEIEMDDSSRVDLYKSQMKDYEEIYIPQSILKFFATHTEEFQQFIDNLRDNLKASSNSWKTQALEIITELAKASMPLAIFDRIQFEGIEEDICSILKYNTEIYCEDLTALMPEISDRDFMILSFWIPFAKDKLNFHFSSHDENRWDISWNSIHWMNERLLEECLVLDDMIYFVANYHLFEKETHRVAAGVRNLLTI